MTRQVKSDVLSSWHLYLQESDTGRDIYQIIKKVDTEFVCIKQVVQYYLTGHGSFPAYLFKIKRRPNDRCLCGNKGDVKHYIFGWCPIMKHHFTFDKDNTIRQNLFKVLLSFDNYKKLKDNYNILNEKFSFIRYKF